MNDRAVTRRQLLGRLVATSAAGAFVLNLAGCEQSEKGNPALTCTDPEDLGGSEASLRESNGYMEVSPRPEQACTGCAYFSGSEEAGCGSCEIFSGPVSEQGYCNVWTAAS